MGIYADKNNERKGQSLNRNLSKTSPIQKKENNTGLPDNLKSGVENLSGYSLDDVKVHYNSSKPATLQAHAYAQGTDIHLAPGQERQLPHEAWHVVQQKQGRVQPTMQLKGSVPVNDDAGLEKEADLMGEKSFEYVSYQRKTIEPLSSGFASQKGIVQASMSELNKIQIDRFKKVSDGHLYPPKGGLYTTVGFEVDVLTTNEGNPIQGMSHLVVGKSTPTFVNQSLGYQLETDAGNILELVTPPYLIETNDIGVLNAPDLTMVVGHLKDGYDAAQAAADATKPTGRADVNKELANITKDVSSGFNANLTPLDIKVYSDGSGIEATADGVVNETHMSPKANLGKLNDALTGKNNLHISAGKGPGFNPQLNIFTSVKNYDALSQSTESRLDKVDDFNFTEDVAVTAVKTNLITRLRARLGNDALYGTSISHLEQTLKVLHPRRVALAKQVAGQKEMFSGKPLTGGESAFTKAAQDVSYVKDQKGVWLKTDIYNYIVKSLERDQDRINHFGEMLNQVYGELRLGNDAGNCSWILGLLHLYTDLKLFRNAKGSRPTSILEDNWGGSTFFTSERVLGIRHDTMLKEKKVKECYEMLNEDSYNSSDSHVLVELRNMGFKKGDSITEINDKLNAFIAAWQDAL